METFLTIVIWLACSLACYKLAEQKNRNPIVGGILGFFFGLIPVIVYLLLSKKEPENLEK